LKTLHLTNTAYPWYTGGKEIYADFLVRELGKQDVESAILIHQTDHNEPVGIHEKNGNKIIVLPPVVAINNRIDTYTREVRKIPGFKDFIVGFKPDIIHFHDQNHGASLTHLRMIHELGIRTILTYHTPGQSCPQRGLLYQNRTPCNGKLKSFRCTECQLRSFNVPVPINYIAASRLFSKADKITSGKLKKMVAHRNLTGKFIQSFNEFYELVDVVHVYAEWVHEMMLSNGVNGEKIRFFRTGGKNRSPEQEHAKYNENEELKLAFIGRCTHIKGVETLIRAVKMMEGSYSVKVYFYGPYWNDSYGRKMLKIIDNDPRFIEPELVSNESLPKKLQQMDLCVVPSLWLETGPITVFDSFSAGIPVIGSNLGGIRELVKNEINGLLFEPGDPVDLKNKILDVIKKPDLLSQMTENIGNPRTMTDVARDTKLMYHSLYQ